MKTRHTTPTANTSPNARSGNTSNDAIRDDIVDWLRDAYGMERGLEGAWEKQSKNQDLAPHIRQRAAQHLEETRRHAELVQSLLKVFGTDTSAIKTTLGVMGQMAKGIGSMFARDERIKDLLDAYSMEHFEIACYMALAAAAEKAGLTEVVAVCRQIIAEEERMAEALRHGLPGEVTDYLFERQTDNV